MSSKTSSFFAEAVGTFALVFIGAGAVTVQGWSQGAVSLVGIALAHGLVLAGMIYAFGHLSGTHVNPAVTVSMVVAKKIGLGQGFLYIIAQLIGAVIAGSALRAIFPDMPNALGSTDLGEGVTYSRGVAIEAILTFLLVTSIFGAAVDDRAPKGFAGLAIGFTLASCILMGGPLTGASLNPARSFGPALASGYWGNHCLYWIGPIAGGVFAAVLNRAVLAKSEQPCV